MIVGWGSSVEVASVRLSVKQDDVSVCWKIIQILLDNQQTKTSIKTLISVNVI